MLRLIAFAIILIESVTLSYLIGFNEGFVKGHNIGQLDLMFVFKHNGVIE